MKKYKIPDTSFLDGLKFTNYNGCREMDKPTTEANLLIAPMQDRETFENWLFSMKHENQLIWWKATGWTEGYGYYNECCSDKARECQFIQLKNKHNRYLNKSI